MVLKVRIAFWGLPLGPGVKQQATTVFLWTSRPATWVKVNCIWRLRASAKGRLRVVVETIVRASRVHRVPQGGVPNRSQVNLPNGFEHQAGSTLMPTARGEDTRIFTEEVCGMP